MLGLGSRLVGTPDGQQWRVGRRWSRRGLPRWRKARVGGTGDSADTLLALPDFDGENVGAAIVVALAAVVFVFVVIPLILFGAELILLGLAIAAGAFVRTLLGRPWVVQAQQVGSGAAPLIWRVDGWRRSNRAIDEVVEALGAGVEPPQPDPLPVKSWA